MKMRFLSNLIVLICLSLTFPTAEAANKFFINKPSANPAFVIKRGGNLTGFFQYGDFSPARLTELNTMKAVGLDFFRLPIEPARFYDAASPDWKNLATTITKANQLGLSVIVDLHPVQSTQDLALTGNGDPRYPALLTNMAKFLTRFNQSKVALELMNEPIAPGDDKCAANFIWDDFQAKFYKAARAGSKNITLIVTGACWGGIDGLEKVKTIADTNLIYSFHNYDPMLFTHQGASWTGAEQWYLRQMPYPATVDGVANIMPTVLYGVPSASRRMAYRTTLELYGQSGFGRAKLAQTLGRAKTWAKRNNVRLIMGEFGVLATDAPPQDRVRWLRDMREIAESLGIPHAVWDFSSTGDFGPYRQGKLEAGALLALGLTAPKTAIATPPNPPIDSMIPANPVVATQTEIANFNSGSTNLAGASTQYFTYGKPADSTATAPSANGAAPIENGQIVFDYSIPASNEFGGVTSVVPVGNINSSQFTHISFDAAVIGGGQLVIALANDKIDTAGDHPQNRLQADDQMTHFSIPFSMFRQAGWGKAVNVNDVIRGITKVEISAFEVGKAGKVIIDNVAFAKISDASNVAALVPSKSLVLYDFELPNNQGNAGGDWSSNAYQQNSASLATNNTAIVAANTGNTSVSKLLEMNFKLPAPNDWAGASASLPFGQTRNLQDFAAMRIDLSATGARTLRVEFANTLDTGNDNPQYIVTISPQQKTYRIPIAEFAQAGWGKRINLQEALQNATGVAVYADTVGTQGKVQIDNVALEVK
jgi:endoglucanase